MSELQERPDFNLDLQVYKKRFVLHVEAPARWLVGLVMILLAAAGSAAYFQ